MMENKTVKEVILETIDDLCGNFLYYDRKEDENLSMDQLYKAVGDGEITVDEMVNAFRTALDTYL